MALKHQIQPFTPAAPTAKQPAKQPKRGSKKAAAVIDIDQTDIADDVKTVLATAELERIKKPRNDKERLKQITQLLDSAAVPAGALPWRIDWLLRRNNHLSTALLKRIQRDSRQRQMSAKSAAVETISND